jgi:hypothetical protein
MICAWCGNEGAKCDAAGRCGECGKSRDEQWRAMLEMSNAAYLRQVAEANDLRRLCKAALPLLATNDTLALTVAHNIREAIK